MENASATKTPDPFPPQPPTTCPRERSDCKLQIANCKVETPHPKLN